jgi:hypothetical protein
MNKPLLLSLIAATVLTGCGKKSDEIPTPTAATNAASSGVKPLDAPAEYLGGMAKGQQSAVKTVDTAALDRALQMYSADNGSYPKDLEELVKGKYIPRIPDPPFGMKIVYDATAGTVKIVRQ